MKTNIELLANAIVENGFGTVEQVKKTLENGKKLPFMTYQEWLNSGYQVQKGEKAAFKVKLWVKADKKDADGNLVNNGFIYKTCSIFTGKQVKPISETEKAEEPKAEPKVEEPKKAPRKAKKTESPKKTRKATTEKVAKATSESKKTVKKSTYETWTDPENPNVHYVKYEKKSKKATRKTEPKKTEEPKLVKEIKKTEPKKTRKAEKKLTKAPAMVRKDFVKDGIKMVQFECSDGTRGFTMPLKNYEKTNKSFRKLWGIA